MSFQTYLQSVIAKKDLTESKMVEAMTQVMEGVVSDIQLAAFLTALQVKKETVPEIAGAAKVMREISEKVKVNKSNIIDTCGTGGDGSETFNISTAVAFVVAGAGLTVATNKNAFFKCYSLGLSSSQYFENALPESSVQLCN